MKWYGGTRTSTNQAKYEGGTPVRRAYRAYRVPVPVLPYQLEAWS
jgi:hypothetical protein